MSYHTIFASIVAVTAMSMFLNEKLLKLPKTIALIIISVSLSFILTQLIVLSPEITHPIHALLSSVDFKTTVLDVMLGYLLFASCIHTNTIALKKYFSMVFYLASAGVVTSTVITGFLFWEISKLAHFSLSLADCLIFGALISPTDPIAVASVFRTTKNVPERIKIKITGESLFNDAASILLLVILTHIFYINDGSHLTIQSVSLIIIQEALGGILWGLVVGYTTSLFLSKSNDSEVSILITLAAASGGYVIASKLHISGVITMVIAGLMVGHLSQSQKFSETTVLSLNKFWDLVDGLLNAFLFVLIGLEMLTITVSYSVILMGTAGIVVVFIARFGSMLLPNMILVNRKKYPFRWPEVLLLCWGGIRGAISLALALSLTKLPESLVAITYFIVIFSILIQGSSFKWLVDKVYPIKENNSSTT